MSLIPHFVVAAVNWCNLDYCESNRNGDPPMKLVTGNANKNAEKKDIAMHWFSKEKSERRGGCVKIKVSR